jgi:hypothetical protein
MSFPWIPSVKRARRLTVHLAPARRSPVWSPVLGPLLDEFNALSSKYTLGVQLVVSDMPPRESGGADVAMDTASGTVSLTFPGAEMTEPFSGDRMHGLTLQLSRDGAMFKAFVFLPATPKINTPRGLRPVGPKVLTLIALHELLHACGLEDHASSGLFQAVPSVDPGTTAAGDQARLQPSVYQYMPPYVIDPGSASELRRLWAP